MIIRTATIEDAEYIGKNLRHADIVELQDGGSNDPGAEVVQAFRDSIWSSVAEVDGKPAVIWGIVQSPEKDTRIPWMLATNGIYKITRRQLLSASISQLCRMEEGGGVLLNFVHAENKRSIQWLQWLGFSISDRPIGNFLKFWRACHV